MKTRFVGIALVALVVVLAGCKISVHSSIADLAPGSLVRYKLELTNSEQGGPSMEHDSEVEIDDEISYFFWDEGEARNPEIRVQASNWSYKKNSYDTGTVQVVFPLTRITDLITTCRLTFERHDHGTHRCEFEEKDTGQYFRKQFISDGAKGHFAWRSSNRPHDERNSPGARARQCHRPLLSRKRRKMLWRTPRKSPTNKSPSN